MLNTRTKSANRGTIIAERPASGKNRVLKPGGRFMIADIIVQTAVPEKAAEVNESTPPKTD